MELELFYSEFESEFSAFFEELIIFSKQTLKKLTEANL